MNAMQSFKEKISFFLLPKVTGQNNRQGKNLTGQLCNLAGHCPLTGRYFALYVWETNKQKELQLRF
jgi:hypothetical protein